MYCINDMFPGPTIEATVGDTVQVNVTNDLMAELITLHWHGLLQTGSPYTDGAAGVTEYGILPQTSFLYQFVLSQSGTYWYHSHAGVQYGDGIFGAFVAYPQNHTKNSTEHTVLISDWFWNLGVIRAARLRNGEFRQIVNEGSFSQSALINGKGQADCTNPRASEIACNSSAALERFQVQSGETHLFRIVGCMSTFPFQFAIQSHLMTVIAIDGESIQPKTFAIINVNIGQRYDVLVNATQAPGDYWIVAQTFFGLLGRAVLSYGNQSGSNNPPAPITGTENFLPNRNSPTFPFRIINEVAQNLTMTEPMQAPNASKEVVLNVLCNDNVDLCFINGIRFKQSSEPILYADGNKRPPQSIQHPQGIPTSIEASGTCTSGTDANSTDANSTSSPNACQTFEITLNLTNNGWLALDIVLASDACASFTFTVFVDNQTMSRGVSVSPGTGTLDWIILPNQLTQGAHTVRLQPSTPACAKSWNATLRWFLGIDGTNVVRINGNDTVQVIVNNLGSLAHPFHMHGHHLYMLGYGKTRAGPYVPQRDNSTLLLNSPPRRDSFLVDSSTWVVFRFVANNPGAWAFHCHIEWHLNTGMAMVWNVDPDHVPNPPTLPGVTSNSNGSSSSGRSSSGSNGGSSSSSSSTGGSTGGSSSSSSSTGGSSSSSSGRSSSNGGSTTVTSPTITVDANGSASGSSALSIHGGLSMSSHLLYMSLIATLLSRWIS